MTNNNNSSNNINNSSVGGLGEKKYAFHNISTTVGTDNGTSTTTTNTSTSGEKVGTTTATTLSTTAVVTSNLTQDKRGGRAEKVTIKKEVIGKNVPTLILGGDNSTARNSTSRSTRRGGVKGGGGGGGGGSAYSDDVEGDEGMEMLVDTNSQEGDEEVGEAEEEEENIERGWRSGAVADFFTHFSAVEGSIKLTEESLLDLDPFFSDEESPEGVLVIGGAVNSNVGGTTKGGGTNGKY